MARKTKSKPSAATSPGVKPAECGTLEVRVLPGDARSPAAVIVDDKGRSEPVSCRLSTRNALTVMGIPRGWELDRLTLDRGAHPFHVFPGNDRMDADIRDHVLSLSAYFPGTLLSGCLSLTIRLKKQGV